LAQNIAIFASGSGSNAEKIVEHFKSIEGVDVKLILTNNSNAFVLERAQKLNVESLVFTRTQFYKQELIEDKLKDLKIDWLVLAGFLWLIPAKLVNLYPSQIINIHPALLPKYGGKGMYGQHVHQAVFDNFEKETGITIHYVNSKYDEGQIIFQKSVSLNVDDTPDKIAKKIHELEYEYFPKIIEQTILDKKK